MDGKVYSCGLTSGEKVWMLISVQQFYGRFQVEKKQTSFGATVYRKG